LTTRHVAVIGGGYSGTLQAIQLLGRGARVTLIERADRLARGVAYSTPHADHLLNVRASSMSAFPDRPDHFAAWLAGQGEGDGFSFARRRTYGRYLESLLERARRESGERLVVRCADVEDVRSTGGGESVRLAGGERIEADAAILALGNLPPQIPREIASAGLADGVYCADPWTADVAAGLGPDDQVLLIGTGLTAIDAALLLDSAGFEGRSLALSRRGLLPRAHAEPQPVSVRLDTAPQPRCTELLRLVRAQSRRSGWHAAVDSLRPVTQAIWAAASPAERQRFLRHLRPWWDVHRHRIAPSIAERLRTMVAAGRLEIAAGRTLAVEPDAGGARIGWRPRGATTERTILVRRIVNCTGPQADIGRAHEPLLDRLIAAGRIRPDASRIGVDVDGRCRTLSVQGASSTLLAIGPITRSAFWEIVAVPDIRGQVRAVADGLTSC
jgi:uncharacterized NAD(P)/FAD-binding protein YdhS